MIALSWLLGCATLDGFVFNGIPCDQVGPDTCEAIDEPWDRVCTPCEAAYDWQATDPWLTQAIGALRPIDPREVAVRRVTTDDGDGELDVVLLRGHGERGEITVLYNHGNYASIEPYIPRIQLLHDAGYSVATWDYRGYGKTLPDSTPSPEQLLADAITVRREVAGWAADPDRVAFYGLSLGAISAVEQGLRDPGCAVLLENPFTSLAAVAQSTTTLTLGEQTFSEGRYDNLAKIADYRGHLLVMTGSADRTFPTDDVLRLADAAGGPTERWIVEGAEHGVGPRGVPEVDIAAYRERVSAFLDEACPAL
jgi:pimeloyl-ACP methyl ester carboxylesterase